MTIDERLERLTERHESLTFHVEALTAGITRMRGIMDDLMTGFQALLEITRNHERRIQGLEGR